MDKELSHGEALALEAIRITKYQMSKCTRNSLGFNDYNIVMKALRHFYASEHLKAMKQRRKENENN